MNKGYWDLFVKTGNPVFYMAYRHIDNEGKKS